MEKVGSTFDALFCTLTTATGIVYAKEIIGIVILSLEAFYIVARLGFKIWGYIKDKKLTKDEIKAIKEDTKDAIESLNEIVGKDSSKDGKD